MDGDIQVPVIEITYGWTVDDIHNEDDCDDAFAVLTAIAASLEFKMDELEEQGRELSHEYRTAKRTLRWKKAALSVVNNKRGRMKREREMAEQATFREKALAFVAAAHPKIMDQAIAHATANLTHEESEKARADQC